MDFAALMQTTVGSRPLIDETGLTLKYDFTLDWIGRPMNLSSATVGSSPGQAPPPADKCRHTSG